MSSIVVEICNLNDPRLVDCLTGIALQKPLPDRVLIADGGSSEEYLKSLISRVKNDELLSKLSIDLKQYPGTQTVTRQLSIKDLKEDITVFLDADEVPVEGWLHALTEPILSGEADFTGGRVMSVIGADNFFTSYYRLLEEHIYEEDLKHGIAYMPLGNTAWKTEILKKLQFDLRLVRAPGEAEDYDLEMRAIAAGFRGKYVPGALVRHYQRIPSTYWNLIKKRYDYLVGASTVMVKNGWIRRRIGERRRRVNHPFAVVEALLKPVALLHGAVRWHIVQHSRKGETV